MKKNNYIYQFTTDNNISVFNTNYELLESLGIELERTHSESNFYELLGRWKNYVPGEWKEGIEFKGGVITRFKKSNLS